MLDDFHRLSSASTRSSVAWFVDHLPSSVQLVVSSRTDPALPLGALRARGQLLELRADELRFTAAEADEFLNGRLGLDLAAPDVELLVARTEGWPAGIYLAALSLSGTRTSTSWCGPSTARAPTSSTSSPARSSLRTSPDCRRSCCAPRCSSACARRCATRSSSTPRRPTPSSRWRGRTCSCWRSTIGANGSASTTSSPRSSAWSSSGASPRSCPPASSRVPLAQRVRHDRRGHPSRPGRGRLRRGRGAHRGDLGPLRQRRPDDVRPRLAGALPRGAPRGRRAVAARQGVGLGASRSRGRDARRDGPRARARRARARPAPGRVRLARVEPLGAERDLRLGRRVGDPRARARARRSSRGRTRPGGR